MTPNLIGRTLGKYRILEEIGQGGMGVVYKAHDATLDRLVAIKILDPRLTRDSEFVQRFLREARAAARFKHPNVVTIYEIAQSDGYHFIVMEYIKGRPLSEIIGRRDALPPKQALHILTQIAQALDYAHARGIVHRDVKPGNVIVDPQGHATLTDFGVAKAAAETRLTRTGTLLGTPAYIAPEQVKGEPVGPTTDVYSLGVVTYEMLGGRPPFEGDTHRLLYAHAHEQPPPLSRVNPSIPRAVSAVVEKALAKEPAKRWPSAGAFATALRSAVRSGKVKGLEVAKSPRRGRLWLALGIMVAALLLLVAAFGVWSFGSDWATLFFPGTFRAEAGATQTPTIALPREPTVTLRATNTAAPTATLSPRPSVIVAASSTRRPTATRTRRPTATPTRRPTATRTRRPTATPSPVPEGVVATDMLNLRAGPDTTHPVISQLQRHATLRVIARTSDRQWLHVRTSGGNQGWVSSDFVALNINLLLISVATTTPTPPRPASTPTPVVVASPTPRPASYARPKLKSPPHEFSTGWPDEVILRWGWPESSRCDPLGPDEYFDVRVWTGGQPHSGIAWTRQCDYSLKNHLISEPAQTFHWAIAVIRGRNGQWQADLSPESDAWSINWRPPR